MADSLSSFSRKIDRLADRLGGDAALKALATKLGVAAKQDAMKAASGDLGGDNRFSGWSKALTTRFEHQAPGVIDFSPQGRSRGPWRVAESRRNQGNSTGFNGGNIGPAAPGRRRARARRRNGTTEGKGTWSDTLRVLERETPGRVQDEVVKQLRRTLGG